MSYEQQQPDTEAAMLEVIRQLRENPEKYQSVQKALAEAESDEERVRTLIGFARDERELAALVPSRPGAETELAWTTVTVTTIFIPSSAY